MIDASPLWDFDDAAGSEQRLRDAAGRADGSEREAWLTQVARALGLQERYDEAHAVLDGLGAADDEVAVRRDLERGRLVRSSGDPAAARPHFESAVARAHEAGLDPLEVDALHMLALVVPPDEAPAVHDRALALARASADPQARAWEASVLNNIGMTHAEAGDFERALAVFEEALAAREAHGRVAETRVARWMVGWALRHLGRRDEALALQRALKAELDAAGEQDPYVDDELAELTGPEGRRAGG